MFYASANWDTSVFERPRRFDLSRSPNPHVIVRRRRHPPLPGQPARPASSWPRIFRELLTRLPDIAVVGEPV